MDLKQTYEGLLGGADSGPVPGAAAAKKNGRQRPVERGSRTNFVRWSNLTRRCRDPATHRHPAPPTDPPGDRAGDRTCRSFHRCNESACQTTRRGSTTANESRRYLHRRRDSPRWHLWRTIPSGGFRRDWLKRTIRWKLIASDIADGGKVL